MAESILSGEEEKQYKPYKSKRPNLLRELAGLQGRSVSRENLEPAVLKIIEQGDQDDPRIIQDFGLGAKSSKINYDDDGVCAEIGIRGAIHPLVWDSKDLESLFGIPIRFVNAPLETIEECRSIAYDLYVLAKTEHPDSIPTKYEREKFLHENKTRLIEAHKSKK